MTASVLPPTKVPEPDLDTVIPATQVPLESLLKPILPLLEDVLDKQEQDDFFMSFNHDLIPLPELMDTLDSTGLTSVDISSIDTLLLEILAKGPTGEHRDLPHLEIHEDGGLDAGCGGKLWLAGKLLSLYLLKHYSAISKGAELNKIVELGSGTGVVGLALSLLLKHQKLVTPKTKLYLTDLEMVLPVLQRNIGSNGTDSFCQAHELDWFKTLAPSYLADDGNKVDLILVADCVYDERLFEILIKTLVMLCELNHKPGDKETTILFTWRKRRRSNLRFFKMLRKVFTVDEITEYEGYEEFQKQRCHLFEMKLKRPNTGN